MGASLGSGDPEVLATLFDERLRELTIDRAAVDPAMSLRPAPPDISGETTVCPEPGAVESPLDLSGLPRVSLAIALAPAVEVPPGPDLVVTRTLGEGGMGRVDLARQRSLGREVAVKRPLDRAPEAASAALVREATVTGALEHPGIVPVHALGVDDAGRPLLVMKRIEGARWLELLARADHPLWSELDVRDRLGLHVEVLTQVCNALEFAHSRGIVHCDVKPENVMVGRFGEVTLLDWGAAARVGPGVPVRQAIVGTPNYMAPELAAGDAVDARTDVFLVGATLHHVLTGQVRHTGRTLTEVLRAAFVCADARYGDDVPEELARLATWATQRDPAARPSSVAVLRRGLADFAAHRAAAALAEEARARVQALRELLGPDPAIPIGDLPGAYRLGTESRFGFTQALAQWPESPGARAGLAACLTTLAELELRQGNTAGARALLVELDGIGAAPPAELLGRIEALEVAREAERSRSLELERLARDLDSSVSRRERLASIGVVGAIAIAVGLVVSFFPGSASPLGLVVFACAILAAIVLLAGVFRGRLLGNAFARRVVLLAFAGGGGLLANRLAGLALGAPVTATLTHDLILMAVTFLAGGCLLDRAFLFGAGVFLAATPLPLLGVLSATFAFTLSSVLALLGTVFLWWRARGGKVPPRS